MGRPKGSKNRPKEDARITQAVESAQLGLMGRTAPEILGSVLTQAKVSAAMIRRAGNAEISDPDRLPYDQVWKQLSSHQKIKAFLDYGVSLMIQPEIALRVIQDLMEDSKEGKMARLAMTRSLIMQTPKEINIDVNTKTGVMLVPAKAENLAEWMAEAMPKTVDGEVTGG